MSRLQRGGSRDDNPFARSTMTYRSPARSRQTGRRESPRVLSTAERRERDERTGTTQRPPLKPQTLMFADRGAEGESEEGSIDLGSFDEPEPRGVEDTGTSTGQYPFNHVYQIL